MLFFSGNAYGCGSFLLPGFMHNITIGNAENICLRQNITLFQSQPMITIVAQYCLCDGDRCNAIRRLPKKLEKNRKCQKRIGYRKINGDSISDIKPKTSNTSFCFCNNCAHDNAVFRINITSVFSIVLFISKIL